MRLRATSSAIATGSMAASSRADCAPWASGTILDALPGVHWSPHGVRYAFTDYGERDLGFSRPSSEAALILDHAERVEPDNVTARFYRSDPAIARKREMMRLWVDWLDGWATKAIQEDARYADRDWLRAEIFRARNGEQRLAARIADRRVKGASHVADRLKPTYRKSALVRITGLLPHQAMSISKYTILCTTHHRPLDLASRRGFWQEAPLFDLPASGGWARFERRLFWGRGPHGSC
jgi:hypothetical protein